MKLKQRSDLLKILDRRSVKILSPKAKEDEEDSMTQKDKIKEWKFWKFKKNGKHPKKDKDQV